MKAGLPEPGYVKGVFLIDTGASLSCMDKTLLATLGIPSSGAVGIATPSTGEGSHNCLVYDVSLFIQVKAPGKWFFNTMVQVAEIDIARQGIAGLIGRDLLATTNFIYNGEAGLFTLAY
jgi:hypothetical protein